MKIYFVYLRRPGGLTDRRDDPFWEFGSFGITGCHRTNLLHPRTKLQDGDRLAFLQGGDAEIKIVALTPPIQVHGSETHVEVRWRRAYRPLPYAAAPKLIDNEGNTTFPKLIAGLRLTEVHRKTQCGRAASRLRSRATALPLDLFDELLAWFDATYMPTTRCYADAIQAPGGRWHRTAMEEGWTSSGARRRQYRRCTLQYMERPVPCPPGSLPKRRC